MSNAAALLSPGGDVEAVTTYGINTWRAISPPPQDRPLALLDLCLHRGVRRGGRVPATRR
jgi:hypothetical protein